MANELDRKEKSRQSTGSASPVTLEDVLAELAYVAFARVSDVQSFDGHGVTLRDSKELPDSVAAAIAEVRVTKSFSEFEEKTAVTVKMHSKSQALSLLAKYFGIDSDFNQARATLKRYGFALVQDDQAELGWQLKRHQA